MTTVRLLRALFAEIAHEAEVNREFAERLGLIIGPDIRVPRRPKHAQESPDRTRPHRRNPGALDPFKIFGERGGEGLRGSLRELNLEQLKDIVAEHGMDQAKLAMKWRTTDRLIDLIATTVRERARKGDAFRERTMPRDLYTQSGSDDR
jgi:hypothetical protein